MPAARSKKEDSPSSDDKNSQLDENGKAKRKRQSQSCDACRARKVRCAREDSDDPAQSCKHCISLGIPCTYEYQPKKRGPPNLYLRRLQEAAAAAQQQQQQQQQHHHSMAITVDPHAHHHHNGTHHHPPHHPAYPAVSVPSNVPHSPFLEHPAAAVTSPTSFGSPTTAGTTPPSSSSIMTPSLYPIAADTYASPPAAAAHFLADHHHRPTTASTDHSSSHRSALSPASEFPPYPPTLYNWSHPLKGGAAGSPGPSAHAPSLPPLNYYVRPHRLEDVGVPRETILLILTLFFDFVHPLTPCIHKPSFMADLQMRREERDPLFFALVMSTVASTCVQIPRSFLPMGRTEVRRLAQTAHEASRHISVASYDPPTSMHVVIRYFDTVYHFCEGHDATSHAAFGEAAHIAVTLHMHEEASYEGLDPIECEIRRRVFWLLFDADKSMSILLGRPICLRDEDCTLHFPKEVDDEYITPNGILPQPPGRTAIISGLNYISRIFALLGEILVRIRVDKRSPPQGHFAKARLEEIHSLHHRIMTALSHAPEPLRLKTRAEREREASINGVDGGVGGGAGAGYDGHSFTKSAFAEVKDFFDNPNASRANASNPFLVMQANLYVTQQLVRFVIEQYRDELIISTRNTLGDLAVPEPRIQEDREAVASDLLNVLHSIPIQSIATNGPSLVHKVRFVASTLLDAVRKVDQAPASAARAHAYLWDFLSILSEIERNYLLDDDREATSI